MISKKRAFAIAGIILATWWVLMTWWATSVRDPIVPQVLAFVAVPVLLIGVLLVTAPPLTPEQIEQRRREVEYRIWEASWTPPQQPPQVIVVNGQDPHQAHLAEQARMFYLSGRETPPTDWYPG